MTKSLRTSCFWILVGIITNVFIGTAIATDITSNPVLVFRIVNSVRVPGEVLERAQKHVEDIYRKSGVRIEWLTGNDIPQRLKDAKRLQLNILLVSEDVARKLRRPPQESGVAVTTDGKGARCAYIFVERVEREANMMAQLLSFNDDKAAGLMLGYVIAHEAGHLMLPPRSHTITGIMRARMDMASMELAIQGRLTFQPEQTKFILQALLAQAE